MKRLAQTFCTFLLPIFFVPAAAAEELSFSKIWDWTGQISDVIGDLDENPDPAQRSDRDWDAPLGIKKHDRWHWKSGDTEFRPWVHMKQDGAGAGLSLQF